MTSETWAWPGWLNNMSAPPKTTVAYRGLAELASKKAVPSRQRRRAAEWVPLRVALPAGFPSGPAAILQALGVDPGDDPQATLETLVEERARALSVPDGCLVLSVGEAALEIRPDPLTAIVIIAKASEFVWLRAKSPRLERLSRVSAVSLYLPAAAAAALQE